MGPGLLRRRLVDLRRDRRGAVAILAAGFGLCLIASAGMTVDVAHVYLTRRSQQAARAALAANGVPAPERLEITLGRYEADGAVAHGARFVASATPANAVRLRMDNRAKLHFARAFFGDGGPRLVTTATAANTRVAAFTIGSRLASLNGGVANAVMSGLLGTSVSLSVMDYDALAAAEIDMPELLAALAPKVGITAGTYDDVLATAPTVGQAVSAAAGLPTVGTTARAALGRLAQAGASSRLDLRELASFGPYGKLALGRATGLSATVSALDLLSVAAGIATGGRQVDVDLGAQVPGLLGLTASIVVGERPQSSPWLTMGAEGVTVRTAQTRLRLIAKVAGAGGLPGLTLPLAIDLAAGEARLASARCGRNPRVDAVATLAVTPSLGELWVGEPKRLADWNGMAKPEIKPATVVDALLLRATASAHVAAASMAPREIAYDAGDIARRTSKTVQATDIARTTLASLTGNLSLTVDLGLLGASLGTPAAVKTLLSGILTPVGGRVDPALNAALKLLGAGLGEADVAVRGLRCDGSALVG
jgi:uncharacterized membrane protein